MAEDLKNVTVEEIESTVKRIEELKSARKDIQDKTAELAEHQKDLDSIATVYGTDSKQYESKKSVIELTSSVIADAEKKVRDLSFKKSELKPVLDRLIEKFQDELKKEQNKEYHIEIAPVSENPDERGNGKKVFKQLLDYLYHNVSFTPQTAANLMVLVRNMEENKAWVNSKDFDNVILLRTASVLSLWRFIMEDMHGKGFYEARTFLECWANCGQAISDAIREIKKENVTSRTTGTQLDVVEGEFNISEDDLPKDEQNILTKEEVAPEVEE